MCIIFRKGKKRFNLLTARGISFDFTTCIWEPLKLLIGA